MSDAKVIIEAELNTKKFDEQLKGVKSKLKSLETQIAQTFNKAVNFGKGLFGVIGKIGIRFGQILFSAGALTTILGSAGLGALSVAGAFKKVFEENEQIKANIQYIVFALNKALEPAINAIANIIIKIINLLVRAVQYTAYLIKAWTGRNIFAGATMDAFADSMASAEKSSGGIAKNAKEIHKQLAGFDEMNVLSDTSSTGGGGGTGGGIGGALPSFDLSMDDFEPPKWLVWIADNWQIVAFGIGAIATALGLLRLGLTPIEAILGGLIVAQIVSVLIGVYNQILNIIDFIKDPSWENFFELIKGFFGTQGLLGILINEAVENIFGGWEEVEKILKPIADWVMDNVINPVINFFTNAYNTLIAIFTPVVEFFKNLFGTVFSNIKIIWDNVVQIFKFAWTKIVEIFGPVIQWFGDLFSKAYNRIKEAFSPVIEFISGLWDKIKTKLKDFGAKVGEVVGGAFKSVINGVLGAMESILNTPIKGINTLINTINKVPGINLSKLNTFSFPRLAQGGIVNNPGPGVMMGSYIAGERGPEAVLPLTDDTLQRLANMIPITVNLTNTMNGRVISRELQKVQNENNFAFNR